MPRTKKKKAVSSQTKMPKGFYLKRGVWYKRLFKPHPKYGQVGNVGGIHQMPARAVRCSDYSTLRIVRLS